MCASTHVLIPTIIDRLSGDALAKYFSQIATLQAGQPAICPHLVPVGVVCTMVPTVHPNYDGVLNELEQKLAEAPIRTQLFRSGALWTHQRPPYRDCAGERIAYAATPNNQAYRDLRDEVDRLGTALAPTLGKDVRGWTMPPAQGWPP
jgi:cellulose biosynthesis protein BcsQ